MDKAKGELVCRKAIPAHLSSRIIWGKGIIICFERANRGNADNGTGIAGRESKPKDFSAYFLGLL
jgi:hypothetical protein